MSDRYDVVVVGSGYGGGIAASRLARAGRSVCVLERGRELVPGEYPDTKWEAIRETQVDLPRRHLGSESALFDFRSNREINVLVGCGLGGTSLINASVAVRPDPRVFGDVAWPEAIRSDPSVLDAGFDRALEMLRPSPYPNDQPRLKKMDLLEGSAKAVGGTFRRLPINVSFSSGVNHVGVEQNECRSCGDCVTGCNEGSKNTVLMNYLPDAKNHGASIFTEVHVRSVERRGDSWVVMFVSPDTGQEVFDAPPMFLTTDNVVLAAGTLGSTEILLRSKAQGLSTSSRLGERFSGNGDIVAFGYNLDAEVNGIGMGAVSIEGREPVGPCITGVIDVRGEERFQDNLFIEEGAIPGALADLVHPVLMTTGLVLGEERDRSPRDELEEAARSIEGLVKGPYKGASNNTQTYIAQSHDDGAGRMHLVDDRLRIDWPEVGRQPNFERLDRGVEAATAAHGGTHIRNPLWTDRVGRDLITVHPLGGCVMADSAEEGVVDHKCRVFSEQSGNAVHPGLFVCDGAVIPRSLGVNPSLTISAVAERAISLMADERGWTIDYSFAPVEPRRGKSRPVGIRFTERMDGTIQAGTTAHESDCVLTVTAIVEDLDRFIEDPEHVGALIGTVTASLLDPEPLAVTNGRVNLFVDEPDEVETRKMTYEAVLRSRGGKSFFFSGYKRIHDDIGPDMWKDTTTLFTTVHHGDSAEGEVVATGELTLDPVDFLRQLRTVEVLHASDVGAKLGAAARFGAWFAGSLYDTYGGVFSAKHARYRVDPAAPPRKRRPLRAPAPEVHHFETDDHFRLRLTRYKGGRKGPVILGHGMGVWSNTYTIDTIDTNLVEYLCDGGYDVWLLDWRASISLPYVRDQFNCDDVAQYDWPAAIETVKRVTGAPSLQALVHCVGSSTWSMSMLRGFGGIHSAVCMQMATQMRVPPIMAFKTGINAPALMETFGIQSLSAYTDEADHLDDRVWDAILRAHPIQGEERCDSAICHRITFLYGELYEHDQLNEATHDFALNEMFGVGNITMFHHLSLIARREHLVDAAGEEVYLQHLDRLNFPIAFIHGAESGVFLPEGTKACAEELAAANGSDLYTVHMVPDFGHQDCLIGKNAADRVYPVILDHLDRTQLMG
jgi:cholesterol oxidase